MLPPPRVFLFGGFRLKPLPVRLQTPDVLFQMAQFQTPIGQFLRQFAALLLEHLPLPLQILDLFFQLLLPGRARSGLRLVPLVQRRVGLDAGLVDDDGRFQLADKAPAINCLIGLGGFLKDRPVFTFGHFFKTLCVESFLSPREYGQLFRQRQRLQIGLGDSNMAELAEFLRVGTTALLLDVIEAGELPPLSRLVRPLEGLHQFCSDPTLTCRVRLQNGQQATALQLQRFYLAACQQFLARRPEAPEEAHEVVAAWEEVLDGLEQLQHSGQLPACLIGTVDWVTKKQLLDEAGNNIPWEARKKIDICYHELAPLGYFQMLQAAGLTAPIVTPQELERAVRTPPPNSPATMRGHYIREFSSDDTELSVNWKCVVIGRGCNGRSIRLARYERPSRVASDRPPLSTHDRSNTYEP